MKNFNWYYLEEAARQYRDEFLDKNDNDISKYDIEDIFIAGAQWRFEQFEKNRLAACDNMTEEEAEREQKFTIDFFEKNNRIPTYSDAIEHGIKLMAEQGVSKEAIIGMATEEIAINVSQDILDALDLCPGDKVIIQIRKE